MTALTWRSVDIYLTFYPLSETQFQGRSRAAESFLEVPSLQHTSGTAQKL